jgi:hypothetical protein
MGSSVEFVKAASTTVSFSLRTVLRCTKKTESESRDGKQENHSHRDPSPGFRLLDLYLHFRVVRGDNTEFTLWYKVHSLGKTISSAGHRNDVLAILRALA